MACGIECQLSHSECPSKIQNASCSISCGIASLAAMPENCECTILGQTCYFAESSWDTDPGWHSQDHKLALDRVIHTNGNVKSTILELCGPPILRWAGTRQAEDWPLMHGLGWMKTRRAWSALDIDVYEKWRRSVQPGYHYPKTAPRHGTRNSHCTWTPSVYDGRYIDNQLHFSGWIYCGCSVPHDTECPVTWQCGKCGLERGETECVETCAAPGFECTATWRCNTCATNKSDGLVTLLPPPPLPPPPTPSVPPNSPSDPFKMNTPTLLAVCVCVCVGLCVALCMYTNARKRRDNKRMLENKWVESRKGLELSTPRPPVSPQFCLKLNLPRV